MNKKVALSIAVGLALQMTAAADTLVLRNGSQIAGKFVSGQSGAIMFAPDGAQARRYDVNDVGRLEFSSQGNPGDRFNSDSYGNDQHSRYDQYRNRPDYRENQAGAIESKYQDMNRAGVGLGAAISAEQASTDGQGRFRVYQNSTVYWSPRTGAHEVHGAIREQYIRVGAENSRLGYPTSDESPAPDGVGRINKFEHGSIYWSGRTGPRVDFANSDPAQDGRRTQSR